MNVFELVNISFFPSKSACAGPYCAFFLVPHSSCQPTPSHPYFSPLHTSLCSFPGLVSTLFPYIRASVPGALHILAFLILLSSSSSPSLPFFGHSASRNHPFLSCSSRFVVFVYHLFLLLSSLHTPLLRLPPSLPPYLPPSLPRKTIVSSAPILPASAPRDTDLPTPTTALQPSPSLPPSLPPSPRSAPPYR